MTTVDATPSLRDYVAMRLISMATKKRKSSTAKPNLTWIQVTMRWLLHVAGFSLLTWAGFRWDIIAGLVIAGLSCFVLSTLMTSRTPADETPPQLRR